MKNIKAILNIIIFSFLIPILNGMQKSDSLYIQTNMPLTMKKSKTTESLPESNYVFYVVDKYGKYSKIKPGKNLTVFYKDYRSYLKYNNSKKKYYKSSKVYVKPQIVIICDAPCDNKNPDELIFYELAFLDAQKIINLTKENLDPATNINNEYLLFNNIIYNDIDLLKKILELDDINFQITDKNGNNLLHYIVKHFFIDHFEEIIKKLISKGCDKKTKNKNKKTPYDLALKINKTTEDNELINKKILNLLNPKPKSKKNISKQD
ncbi:MAG: hypothetical protein SZ59_C0002G0132 [candidate division TM6 bacterium GW2011_GWF2_28_16]|nr:MAG: hypothetical protein SZ59_C0002G0132 [candidate division TM6 bacterium GW2011_GWF2_28_16]